MKLIEILHSQNGIAQLCDLALPFTERHKLRKIKVFIESELSFYDEEEKKLLDKYAKHDEEGKVMFSPYPAIVFNSEDDRVQYARKITELRSTDIANECDKVCLTGEMLQNLTLTLHEEDALMNFVKAEEK